MVLDMIRGIEKRAANDMAHRVRNHVSDVFVWAIASGLADTDPAAIIRKALVPTDPQLRPAMVKIHRRAEATRHDRGDGRHPLVDAPRLSPACAHSRPAGCGSLSREARVRGSGWPIANLAHSHREDEAHQGAKARYRLGIRHSSIAPGSSSGASGDIREPGLQGTERPFMAVSGYGRMAPGQSATVP
jgi:hypothetical protein